MCKLRTITLSLILLMVFLQSWSEAYTWTGDGHYQIGGEFGYPNPDAVNTYDTVTVTIVHGGGVGNAFNMYDSSHLDMYDDGYIDELNLYQHATVSLFGAEYIGHIWVDSASTGWVKFYATNVSYGRTSIIGNWLSNGQYFDLDFTGDTYLHVQIVPEPATLVLLGLGSLAILRRRK